MSNNDHNISHYLYTITMTHQAQCWQCKSGLLIKIQYQLSRRGERPHNTLILGLHIFTCR